MHVWCEFSFALILVGYMYVCMTLFMDTHVAACVYRLYRDGDHESMHGKDSTGIDRLYPMFGYQLESVEIEW